MTDWVLTERETEFDRGNVPPNAGGCWFCYQDHGLMGFSLEFDCYYHEKCAEKAGVLDNPDPVAAYERQKLSENA